MKVRAPLGLIVLLLCIPILAQKQKELPRALTVAQFVFVETPYGSVESTLMDSRVTPEDRKAVINVEKAIHDWGRYQLTLQRSEADLIVVVRPGRMASVNAGVRIAQKSQPVGSAQSGPKVGTDYGAEVGQAKDSMAVYPKTPDGSIGNPIWLQVLDHGLDAPNLTLVKKFKDEVEASASTLPKKTP